MNKTGHFQWRNTHTKRDQYFDRYINDERCFNNLQLPHLKTLQGLKPASRSQTPKDSEEIPRLSPDWPQMLRGMRGISNNSKVFQCYG